jgi:protoporphyrinogen oxidase
MGLREPPPGSIADMQRQINALVTELALKERQLRDVSVDDLARCLLDAQQSTRDLRTSLTTKEEELSRIKLQLKQLNSGNNDSWDKIVADSSAECIRLRREVDEVMEFLHCSL